MNTQVHAASSAHICILSILNLSDRHFFSPVRGGTKIWKSHIWQMIRKLFLKKMNAKTNQLPKVTWNLLKLHLGILINEETPLPTYSSAPWSAPLPPKKPQQLSGSKNLQLWTPLEVKACHLAVTFLNYISILWCSWISFNWHLLPKASEFGACLFFERYQELCNREMLTRVSVPYCPTVTNETADSGMALYCSTSSGTWQKNETIWDCRDYSLLQF